MLSKRQIQLINCINNATSPISSNQLADKLAVSSKTIKRDVKDINALYDKVIKANEKGYYGNNDDFLNILNNSETLPESFDERKTIILKQLLTKNKVSVSELTDRLLISSTTLQNDLFKVHNYLDNYNLNLHNKNDYISISGSDKDKQKLLIELFNDELKDSFYSLDKIQNFFKKVNLKELKDLINSILLENEYFLDDYSLTNYIFHVALLIENGIKHPYKDIDAYNTIFNDDIIVFVNILYEQIKNRYPNSFTKENYLDASFLMMTRLAKTDYIPDRDITTLVDEKIINLVTSIIRSVKFNLAIDLNTPDFVVPFTFHVKNLLIRLQNNTQVVNLQFEQIKTQFPLLYSIGVFIAEKIENYSHSIINEDEIAFIAMHVGTVVEKRKIEDEKLKCIIVAPDYYSLKEKIANALNERFRNDIFIKDIIVSDNAQISKNVDLCITTFSDNFNSSAKMTLNITPFITDDDLKKVNDAIENLKNRKKKHDISKKFKYFLNPDLFFINPNFKTRDKVINKLCISLKEKGFVDDLFRQKIYQREEISSSAFGNTAIPHPLDYNGEKSIIAVIISKNGIVWDKNIVNFIFMFSLNNNDRSKFSDVFDSISFLVNDKTNKDKLLAIKSFDEFIELISQN